MNKMSATVSADIKSNGDGTYDAYISTGDSSGEHYDNLTAREVGEHITDLIDCLEDAASGNSFHKERWELIETDGYSINKTTYDSKELAVAAMKARYNMLNKNKDGNDWDNDSFINDTSAMLYEGGNDVFVWQCYKI